MLVLDPGPSPSPRLNASSENQIGNVSFHSSWNNKTHKFMQSLLEHKVTICCVLGTHTHKHTHTGIKKGRKKAIPKFEPNPKDFIAHSRQTSACASTEYAPSRLMRMCLRRLFIQCRRVAGFEASSTASLHPNPIPNPFFHRTQTHGWTECVSRFSAADHTGQQKQQQRLGSLSCIPLKHELAFLPW